MSVQDHQSWCIIWHNANMSVQGHQSWCIIQHNANMFVQGHQSWCIIRHNANMSVQGHSIVFLCIPPLSVMLLGRCPDTALDLALFAFWFYLHEHFPIFWGYIFMKKHLLISETSQPVLSIQQQLPIPSNVWLFTWSCEYLPRRWHSANSIFLPTANSIARLTRLSVLSKVLL